MIILKAGNSTYHFLTLDTMRQKGKRPVAPAGFQARTAWFGTQLMAETFLKRFAGDRAAGAEVGKLLGGVGGPLWFNAPAAKWAPELAALLVSGEVVVIEMAPRQKDVSTKSKKVEVALPVPRKAPVAEKPVLVEQATFPPLNDDDQAQALAVAAQAGAPFCEVCNRA